MLPFTVHGQKYVHTYIRTYERIYTQMHTQAHTHTCTHTHTHLCTPLLNHLTANHLCTHPHAHTPIPTKSHTYHTTHTYCHSSAYSWRCGKACFSSIPRWARTNTAFPCGPAPSAPPPSGTVIFPSSTTENMNARMDACTVRPAPIEEGERDKSSNSFQDTHTHKVEEHYS